MTMSGGTINCERCQIGWDPKNAATASLTMTGGLLVVREQLSVGSSAQIHLNGGTIMCADLQIEEGGEIILCGGTLIIDGFWPYPPYPIPVSSYCPRPTQHIYGSITCCYGRPVFDYLINPGKTTVYCRWLDPFQPSDPGPPNGIINVPPVDVTVCWVSGEGLGLGRHYVYFSDDYDCVANAACGDTGSPCFKALLRASTRSWNAGLLELWKTYYWRVDEVGVTCCKGGVWRFTTGCELIPGDVNLDCVLNFEDFAAVAETFGEEQFWPED
jgi:hypothetical protein